MYLSPPTFDAVVVYLCGYIAALDGGFLVDFREWMIVKTAGRQQSRVATTGRGNDMSPAEYFTDENHRRILADHQRWIRHEESDLANAFRK